MGIGNLDRKVAIVTGGAQILGAAVVTALHEAGASVVIGDINTEDGGAVSARLGERAAFVETDITDDEQLDSLVAMTVERFGGIDILVNGAATYLDSLLETTREDWHTAIDVNLVSGVLLTARVAPHMAERGGGSVINFASVAGKRAGTCSFVYGVTKAANLGVTRNEAVHLAPMKIRVNSISPGWTWSTPVVNMTRRRPGVCRQDRRKLPPPGPHCRCRGGSRRGGVPRIGRGVVHHRSRHTGGRRTHGNGT